MRASVPIFLYRLRRFPCKRQTPTRTTKLHFKDTLKVSLKNFDMDIKTWEGLAHNRSSWRSYVHKGATSLQQCPYAPRGSTTLLPKLSVTSKVSAPTSCAWVGSRVRFRSSEDVTLLEFTSPVDLEYMRRCQEVSLNLKPRKYRLRTSASLPKFPTTLWCIRAQNRRSDAKQKRERRNSRVN